jgi:hypothetical protein
VPPRHQKKIERDTEGAASPGEPGGASRKQGVPAAIKADLAVFYAQHRRPGTVHRLPGQEPPPADEAGTGTWDNRKVARHGDHAVRYFRVFGVDEDAVLCSRMLGLTGQGFNHRFPPPLTAPPCPKGHQPPADGCDCGLYLGADLDYLCQLPSMLPKVYAELRPVGPLLPDPEPDVYREWGTVRAAGAKVVALWVPHALHCVWCNRPRQTSPGLRGSWVGLRGWSGLDRDTAAQLAERYRAPVRRLPPAPHSGPLTPPRLSRPRAKRRTRKGRR